MEGKPSIEVPISELPIEKTADDVAVHSVVYLNRSALASGELLKLPSGTASRRLGDSLYSAGQIRAKHIKCLEILHDVPTYELRYCDLKDAIEALESLI